MIEDETDTEFRDLVVESLTQNGALSKIKAELRAQIYLTLEDNLEEQKTFTQKIVKDSVTAIESLFLIYDYLNFYNFDFTLSVFEAESDFNTLCPFEKQKTISEHLNINENGNKKPALVQILERLKEKSSGLSKENNQSTELNKTYEIPADDCKKNNSKTKQGLTIIPEKVDTTQNLEDVSMNVSLNSTRNSEASYNVDNYESPRLYEDSLNSGRSQHSVNSLKDDISDNVSISTDVSSVNLLKISDISVQNELDLLKKIARKMQTVDELYGNNDYLLSPKEHLQPIAKNRPEIDSAIQHNSNNTLKVPCSSALYHTNAMQSDMFDNKSNTNSVESSSASSETTEHKTHNSPVGSNNCICDGENIQLQNSNIGESVLEITSLIDFNQTVNVVAKQDGVVRNNNADTEDFKVNPKTLLDETIDYEEEQKSEPRFEEIANEVRSFVIANSTNTQQNGDNVHCKSATVFNKEINYHSNVEHSPTGLNQHTGKTSTDTKNVKENVFSENEESKKLAKKKNTDNQTILPNSEGEKVHCKSPKNNNSQTKFETNSVHAEDRFTALTNAIKNDRVDVHKPVKFNMQLNDKSRLSSLSDLPPLSGMTKKTTTLPSFYFDKNNSEQFELNLDSLDDYEEDVLSVSSNEVDDTDKFPSLKYSKDLRSHPPGTDTMKHTNPNITEPRGYGYERSERSLFTVPSFGNKTEPVKENSMGDGMSVKQDK